LDIVGGSLFVKRVIDIRYSLHPSAVNKQKQNKISLCNDSERGNDVRQLLSFVSGWSGKY